MSAPKTGADPYSAGIMAGGMFLSQYMAQQAQEQMARKQAQVQAQLAMGENDQNYGKNQNEALQNLVGSYRSALLGG
jgi:predicted transcriptional regulator